MSEYIVNTTNQKTLQTGNERREKFVKLAERRTVNAMKAIRIIGKLGNPNAYEYDDNDVKKIVKALTDEIEAMKTRMKNAKPSDSVDFKL